MTGTVKEITEKEVKFKLGNRIATLRRKPTDPVWNVGDVKSLKITFITEKIFDVMLMEENAPLPPVIPKPRKESLFSQYSTASLQQQQLFLLRILSISEDNRKKLRPLRNLVHYVDTKLSSSDSLKSLFDKDAEFYCKALEIFDPMITLSKTLYLSKIDYLELVYRLLVEANEHLYSCENLQVKYENTSVDSKDLEKILKTTKLALIPLESKIIETIPKDVLGDCSLSMCHLKTDDVGIQRQLSPKQRFIRNQYQNYKQTFMSETNMDSKLIQVLHDLCISKTIPSSSSEKDDFFEWICHQHFGSSQSKFVEFLDENVGIVAIPPDSVTFLPKSTGQILKAIRESLKIKKECCSFVKERNLRISALIQENPGLMVLPQELANASGGKLRGVQLDQHKDFSCLIQHLQNPLENYF